MSLLTLEKTLTYNSICMNLQADKQIQFACVVNNKGRIIAGQPQKFLSTFGDEKNFEVFLMEIALEFSMRREFDNKFGAVEYVFSKRRWANVINIPLDNNVLVIIFQNTVEPQTIVKKFMPIMETNLQNLVI